MSGITLCITFLSITFYGAGKAYRVAYLHQFGVSDSMLPWSTQDLIYLGATKKLTTILWAYPALVGFLSAMILFMWGSYKTGKYLERRFVSKTYTRKSKNPDLDAPYTETAFLYLIMLNGLVLFILILFCLLYCASTERLGKTEGIEDRKMILESDDKILQNNGLLPATIETSNQGKSNFTTVYFFSCSEKACIGLEKVTEKIFYIPLDKYIGLYNVPTPSTSQQSS